MNGEMYFSDYGLATWLAGTAWHDLWPNFSPQELACRSDGSLRVNIDALSKLQKARKIFGWPIVVTSAYRTPEHNAAIGGAKKSLHLEGRAFDIRGRQLSDYDFDRLVAALKEAGFTGFGIYRGGDKHIHVDNGEERTWYG